MIHHVEQRVNNKNFKMDKVIVTSISELQLMFMRLAIDVLENPDRFKPAGKGIERFYYGENKRRNLENRDIEAFQKTLLHP